MVRRQLQQMRRREAETHSTRYALWQEPYHLPNAPGMRVALAAAMRGLVGVTNSWCVRVGMRELLILRCRAEL